MAETLRPLSKELQPKPGDVIEGKSHTFWLGELLGQGNYSDVFQTYVSSTNEERVVAAKILAFEDLFTKRFTPEELVRNRDSARQEARILSTLVGAPNILPFILYEERHIPEGLEIDSVPIIGTMIANQGPLIRRVPHMSLLERVDVLSEVAGALDKAHANNIVHGDIKLSNILCHVYNHEEGEVRLLGDWGTAEEVNPIMYHDYVFGTFTHMAPERAIGLSRTANDIYSLGVLAYRLGTGYMPFDLTNDDEDAWIKAHQEEPFRPIKSLFGIHPGATFFEPLIKATSAKDPDDRPTIREVMSEIQLVKEDLSTLAETDRSLHRPMQEPPTRGTYKPRHTVK